MKLLTDKKGNAKKSVQEINLNKNIIYLNTNPERDQK